MIEKRISKERWVNLRGNLRRVYFNSKCNGPNGLSRDSTNIQSLESYQLDDLPAGGENCTQRRKASPRTTTATFLG
jgi:hypothetical protein